MTPTHLAAGGSEPLEAAAGQTVVVGVKLDARSKELLTWSLLKLATPGDRVIALHVMANHEIVDPEGKSSLVSVVEAFDSALTVYEGFCNLKQVDLKLKICRGKSVGKALVREAESCCANKLILGITSKHHKFKSSASIAKYCAKKLSETCSVLAVHNGKIMFHREASLHVAKSKSSPGNQTTSKVKLDSCSDGKGGTCGELEQEQFLVKAKSECTESALKKDCVICSPEILGCLEDFKQEGEELEKSEVASSSVSCELKEILASKPESPLSLGREDSDPSIEKSEVASGSVSCELKEILENRPESPLSLGRGDSDPSVLCQSSMDGENSSLMNQLNSDDDDVYSDLEGENSDMIQEASKNKDALCLPLELEALRERYSSACRLFSYHELELATSNFARENLIGKGGNSRVYEGRLPDGKKLAVKILRQSEDVLKDFVFEIDIITSLGHKNIISLFGFCFEADKLLLVYDLLPRGSLEENLHDKKKDPVTFGWNERYKVAVGVAEALNYLHQCNGQPVIHRDVKSSNILLSDDFEPKLSDFGLAKWASTSNQKAFCDIAGTFGYLAPEYFMFGKVTYKIDVYAYGVVLLELLSGRKPISTDHPKGQESLVMWILKLIEGDAETMKWAKLQFKTTDNPGSPSSIQCHLNLALLDVEDDLLSVSSTEQNVSLEDYLNGRSSRSSSLD